jgi:aminopeptidase N
MYKWFLLFVLLAATLVRAQDIDVLHYKFNLKLNDESNEIAGVAELTFIFKKPVDKFKIDLVRGGSHTKGMNPQIVQNEFIARAGFNDSNIVFRLKQLPVLDSIYTLTIVYNGVPADGLIISKNKHGDRTFFADNWPNRAHHWIPCVDRPDDKASFEFIVTTPSHYSVISNGIKVEEKENGYGSKTTHWREDIPQPTKVMVIGVAHFAKKTFVDSPNDIPVSAWVYPKDSTKGFYDFALAPEILKFFADYIAPFPYKKLANVQSKTIFGGMENASTIFYAENLVTGDRSAESTIAHEIAHQWFGDMASEKSFAHLWLSEGFASYMTHIYYENKYSKEAFQDRLKADREEIIDFAKQSSSPVVDSTSNLMSLLNANSYQKGAWVLHMLRNEVGDKTFQKIIQAYYHQYKGGNAETRDFEAIAERVSGKELTWFFDQWLYRPGIPLLQTSTAVQNNEFTLTVKQQGKPYRLTLEVDIVAKDGEVIRQCFNISKKEETFTALIKGSSAQFTLDPDTKLLYKLKD